MQRLKGLLRIIKLFLTKKYIDLNDIANSYTRVSKIYNDSFLKEMHKYNKEMLDKVIIRHIDNKANSSPKILDIACGTGFNSDFINSKINHSKFTLVDMSEGMLNQAKNNCNLDAEFIKSDMLSFLKSSKDNSFDIVICAWAIKYQNPHEIIKEVSRVLKKDGYFAVIVNLKSTLPEVRKIYPKLLLRNYKNINKIMKELPNPIHHKTFTRWFQKEGFSKIEVKSGSHIFTFGDTKSLVSFVTSTGALAGFDAMVDMQDDDVRNLMIKLFLNKAKALKESGLFGVGISIDSLYKENHDKKRGYNGAYDNSISAIKNCKKADLYTMAQTVCTKEMLKSGEIYELGKFLKTLGVDEVRILEPIPCGSLLVKSNEIFTKEDKEELINLHIKFNRDKNYPKTSVFPYVESKDQFGCGAGVQHSYIDNEGNFLPCDFVPESFGNVLNEDIKDIWDRMHIKLERAKTYCYAKKCDKCNEEELPKYYRLLRVEK